MVRLSDYVRLLRGNPDFARLWVAQVISWIGDWFNTIVLSALVASYSSNPGIAVSGFFLARLLPPMLFSPLAGVLVDRFERKRLLIFSDVGRTVIVLLFVPVVAAGPDLLWLLYVLTIAQFLLSAIFEPGRSAIVPSLLRPEELVLANTLSSSTWSAVLAVGALTGGVVALTMGITGALVVDALSFALSAALISQIRVRRSEASVAERLVRANRKDTSFREGLRYLRGHPETAFTLLVKLGQSLGNVDALVTIYATRIFVMGNDATTPLSIMYAAFGVGAVAGPLIMNTFNDGAVRTMRRLIVVGFAAITAGWLVLGGASTLPVVAVALVMRAMGGSVNWTYSSVIIQKSTPDEYLGRTFSLDMAGYQFASIIGILTTGLLVDALGAQNVRQVVALMAGISLIPLVLWTLAVFRLEKRDALALPVGD